MAGELTTIVGAILALADAVLILARRHRGRRQPRVLPVISILALAIIVLGVLALIGVKELASFLP